MTITDNPILCVDFGTTNSSACWVHNKQITPVPLEQGNTTIPSSIFFNAEDSSVVFGKQALQQYLSGQNGRLMKSLKSILGSSLIEETTAISGGMIQFRRVLELFLLHIKNTAEAYMGSPVSQVLLGRPVRFVDDNELSDKKAENTLRSIASEIGFSDVYFQYEPFAAALNYETTLNEDKIVLIVDIGGGTSDFSLLNLGPAYRDVTNRADSVIGTAGIHIAGTDFDKLLNLSTAMKSLGFGTIGKSGRETPNYLYYELSTWHKINTLYNTIEIERARGLKHDFVDGQMHERLMLTLRQKYGHRIAGAVESAKEQVSEGGSREIELGFIEDDLSAQISEVNMEEALVNAVSKIVNCAEQLVSESAINKSSVSTLYFTGGSTAMRYLRRQFQQAFPTSDFMVGEQFISVSQGLAISAINENWIVD